MKLKTSRPLVSPILVLSMIGLVVALAVMYMATQGDFGTSDIRSQAANTCNQSCIQTCRTQDASTRGQCVRECIKVCIEQWSQRRESMSTRSAEMMKQNADWLEKFSEWFKSRRWSWTRPTNWPTPTGGQSSARWYCMDNNCGRRVFGSSTTVPTYMTIFDCTKRQQTCTSKVGFSDTSCRCSSGN